MLIYLVYLVIGLMGIGLIIFLHELGHFAAARLMKVDVDVLSYGMGPRLFSIYGRNTEYRLSLIPFGGYCRMKGSLDLMKALKDDAKSMDRTEAGSYFGTTPLVRFFIYLSGPLMNFILAVLLLTAVAALPVDRLSDPAVITPVSSYYALFQSDIRQSNVEKGDRIIALSGHTVLDWQDAEDYIKTHSGEIIPAIIERNGAILHTELIPTETANGYAYGITNLQEAVIGRSLSDDFLPGDKIVEADGKAVEYTIDVYSIDKDSFQITIDRDGELLARDITGGILPFAWQSALRKSSESNHPFSYGVRRTFEMAGAAMKALGAFITLHFEDALTVITGPVKAAESIGGITALAFSESSLSGIRAFFMLMAMVSISISVGNTLPIPTFDGGQMLINIVEMINHRELSPRTYVILQIAGMILALLIMVMMYSLDIKAYFFS